MWRTAFDLLVWFCPFPHAIRKKKRASGELEEGNWKLWREQAFVFRHVSRNLSGEIVEFHGANRKICVPVQKTLTPFWSLLSGVDVLALLRNRFRIEESLLDVCQ